MKGQARRCTRRHPRLPECPGGLLGVSVSRWFIPSERSKHGNALDGMPRLELVRGKDGHMRINDGVTRATRAAKLRPGVLVPAEVIQELRRLDVTRMPKVKDCLP